MRSFESVFAEHLKAYIKLRRGLGYKFESQEYLLRKFDQYAESLGHKGLLDQKLASDFASEASTKSAAARRYEVVRHFSQYLAVMVPKTPVLDRNVMKRNDVRVPAFIFTNTELSELLNAARTTAPRNPIRGVTLHSMIGLAASSGLRPREVICLNKQDVDWDRGILEIERTKFKKDRIVPVHASAVDALREYTSIRDAAFRGSSCEAFFINERGTRFSSAALESAFRKLTRRIGLRGPRGRGPTFGDLRHTFAVNRLVAWYREGADVQAKLPLLATYMGHVEYSYTAYYITATTELRTLAQERLGQWLNGKEEQQ